MASDLSFGERRDQVNLWAVITAAVVGVAYAPMLFLFFQQQWSRPQSQFFPFVIAACAGLFWMRWKEAPAASGNGTRASRWVAVRGALAWLALTLAATVYNPWLSAASFCVLMAAVGIIVGRRREVTYLWGIWAMLWLMLPLPLGLDQQLISRLQLVSSKLSSFLLDAFSVDHFMSGNMLLLPDKQLFVDEACSGIVSVMSIVACGVIYGVWRNRPPLHIVGLAACGVFWAMVMNVVRITVIAVVHDWYGRDWTEGAPHEVLSLVVFLFTFGALLSTDLVLLGLFAPIEMEWKASIGGEIKLGRLLSQLWDRLVEWGNPLRTLPHFSDGAEATTAEPRSPRFAITVGIAFGMLAAGQLGVIAWAHAHPAEGAAGVAEAQRLDRDSLPPTLAGAHRADFKAERRERDDIFGEFSRAYVFRGADDQPYHVSCDFPFSQGWHELTVCYTGAGWEIAKRKTTNAAANAADREWTIVEAELERSDGSSAFVAWTMFDDQGEPVSPPTGALRNQAWRLLVRRSPLVPTRQMFQVQVMVQAAGAIDENQRATARELLLEAREEFRREIAGEVQQ